MSIVKVTKKRQIMLPKEACDRLGIAPGDYVKVYVDKHGRIVDEKVIGIDKLEGALNPSYQVEGLTESLDEERKHGERQ
ncbi:MAG: AbrB/MazE/SpoVT family DNA-binding domain-containing protein [Desulfurococcales archaeon]|nr:AbrB/MazE/SpoVT family DNA-binding domain-containing protein [Desulfurococcales archaeon]